MGDVEIGDVGGEAFGGDLEGGMGARAGFVEKHQDGLPFEGGDFFYGAGEELLEGNGLVEEEVDFLAVEGCDVE